MDLYSKEVQRVAQLTPGQALKAWCYGPTHSPLFDGCSASRGCVGGGCLTQVKQGMIGTASIPFHDEIKQDDLIPAYAEDFFKRKWRWLKPAKRIQILRRFAYWQRCLDRFLIGRAKPMAPGGARDAHAKSKS